MSEPQNPEGKVHSIVTGALTTVTVIVVMASDFGRNLSLAESIITGVVIGLAAAGISLLVGRLMTKPKPAR
jgi:hypothetical protein